MKHKTKVKLFAWGITGVIVVLFAMFFILGYIYS